MMIEKKAKKVCIVDDDRSYRFLATKIIEGSNVKLHKIMEFSDGEKAINFLSTNREKAEELPDLIILDINMPRMNGWEFMEAFSKLKAQLPEKIAVYMVSSSSDIQEILRAENHPDIREYVLKPFSEDKFREMADAV